MHWKIRGPLESQTIALCESDDGHVGEVSIRWRNGHPSPYGSVTYSVPSLTDENMSIEKNDRFPKFR